MVTAGVALVMQTSEAGFRPCSDLSGAASKHRSATTMPGILKRSLVGLYPHLN